MTVPERMIVFWPNSLGGTLATRSSGCVDKTVVLACTIRQDDVSAKISSDIAKLGQQDVDMSHISSLAHWR